jgi:nitrite reductase/ring-hydroxylating ferredoxin subunit
MPEVFPFYAWLDEKTEVILINEDGKIRAFQSICPHMGARLEYQRKSDSLFCPWHGLKFCTKSQQSCHTTYKRIREFRVEQKEGNVLVYDK